MSHFQELFQAYGGDYQSTMERFMGNEGMYLRILDMLFDDENLDKLGQALAQRDYEAAFEAAHTLKGVVGNMGLTPLYDAVCTMVEPLRVRSEQEDYERMYQSVRTQFAAVDQLRRQLKGGNEA